MSVRDSIVAANDKKATQFFGRLAEEQTVKARLEERTTEALKIAQRGRLTHDWFTKHISGDSAIAESWDLGTQRARDLAVNEPSIKKVTGDMGRLLVGTGIQTYASATVADELDDDFNFESDDWYERWAEEEADAEGEQTIYEMQDQLVRDTCATGNGLLIERSESLKRNGDRSVPLCYQGVEWEQLDRTKDRPAMGGQSRIVNGIEFQGNRRVGYWFYDVHPFDTMSGGLGESTFVPASKVLHWYIKPRWSAKSGITWHAASAFDARDLDGYLGTELTTAKMAAGALMSHKSPRFAGDGTEDGGTIGMDADANEPVDDDDPLRLGYPYVAQLAPDDEVDLHSINRPNSDAAVFVRLMLLRIAMGHGLSYIRLTGDLQQASYTSARAAQLLDEAFRLPLQHSLGSRVVRKIRKRHNAVAAAMGLYQSVSATQFAKQQARWQRFEVQGPGREQLQPDRETDAMLGRLRSGVSTYPDECAKAGRHWRRNINMMARVNKYAAKKEVVLDWSKGQGDRADKSTAAAGDKADSEAES